MRRSIMAPLGAAMVMLAGAPSAFASVITDFGVFGDTSVSLGGGLTDSAVGSNGAISAGSNVSVTGNVEAGGDVNTGGSLDVGGNVIADGAFSTGTSSTVAGNIDAGGDVSTGSLFTGGGNVTTGGAFSTSNHSSVTGDVDAVGNGSFGTGSTVSGNLTLGGTLAGRPPTVGGTTTENGMAASPASYMPVTVPGASSFGAGGTPVSKGNFETTDLAPGTYGSLSLGSSNTLKLTAPGEYYFDSWDIGNNLDLYLDLDAGAFSIFVVGDVDIIGNLYLVR